MINGLMVGSKRIPYPQDGPIAMMRGQPYIMGLTAEFLAAKHKISREEQDEIALRSHNNVERATLSGAFASEIVPVEIKGKKGTVVIDKDEHFRPGLTAADLAKLKPAFIPNVGTVTAGNSSGMNDGAAAMVLVCWLCRRMAACTLMPKLLVLMSHLLFREILNAHVCVFGGGLER